MNSLFNLLDYFAGQYREADKTRKPMVALCRWWLENVRNLAILAALGYVTHKIDNIVIKVIFQISIGAYTWYFLYPIIIIMDVVFPIVSLPENRLKINPLRLLQWTFCFLGIFYGTTTLIKWIVEEVVKAQHS